MDVLIEPVNNRFNPFFEDPILDEEEEEEEEEEELLMMMVTMVTMMMIMMLLLLIQRQRQQRHDNNNNNDNVMIRKRRRPHHEFGDYVEHMRLFQRRRVAGNKHTGFMFLNKVDYHTGTILAKNFRRLIGFSNHAFTELVRNARESRVNNGNGELVPRFIDETHSLKGRPIPISLEDKIICAIVYLKVGCSFKHLEATMMISASIQAIFFWKFTEWIATVKFGEMVRIPQNQAELDLLMAKYANLGFPGACGSMDATHFRANKIPSNRRHQAKKAQATYPTYVANFVFDPNGLVLSMSPVYYGATNDIILADAQDYVKELGTNPLFASAQYAMKDLDGNEIRETGAYFLCDGGYRQSRFFQFPCKEARLFDSAIGFFSRCLESVRKDAEDGFAHLKSEFGFLDKGINISNPTQVQNAIKTCVYFHNLALRENGFNTRGDQDDDYIQKVPTLADYRKDMFDERRIQRSREGLQPGQPLILHYPPAGNNITDQMRIEDHFERRARIAQHILRLEIDGELLWLRERGVLFNVAHD